ncbi:amidohydrolase family protein, partial [candidate division KSB1 bacterium]|nr:amidohydrolase family protein [candidate division KSB1 bacterium]
NDGPTSLMGAMALIRQTCMDAQWYRTAWERYDEHPEINKRPEFVSGLDDLVPVMQGEQRVAFHLDRNSDYRRVWLLAQEFKFDVMIYGTGTDFWQRSWTDKLNCPVVLPLTFPQSLTVENPDRAYDVSLAELQDWAYAPSNPMWMNESATIALTSHGLKKPDDFFSRLRLAVQRGWPKQSAIAALTVNPATFIGMEKTLGTLEQGKIANLVVMDKELFDDKSRVMDVWIDGRRFESTVQPDVDIRGKWKLSSSDRPDLDIVLDIKGASPDFKGTITVESRTIKSSIDLLGRRLSVTFPGDSLGLPGFIRTVASVGDSTLTGYYLLPDASRHHISGIQIAISDTLQAKKTQDIFIPDFPQVRRGGFGAPLERPYLETVLIRDGIFWTNSEKGILRGDMLVEKGKIVEVDSVLDSPGNAFVIEANGRHVTPGLIDAHSHTGIDGGTNEFSDAVTAQVRIKDVIDPNDIAFYRVLAGGLTTTHIMHGSANPIGGQNAVVKIKWGKEADEMIMQSAPEDLKFALGENVKRSNWGGNMPYRYPSSRMGVEQILRDYFYAAQEYNKEWQQFKEGKNRRKTIPPRRDLQLDPLVEILQGERDVHCHAYRQDEMLMFIRLANEFGIKNVIFEHGLEGFKIADEIAKNGFGVTSFSDWWMYKFEVFDAIPHNGAILYHQGASITFNSDSNELSRRLAKEAAKAVRYGNVPRTEALGFVTLYSARQLGVDDRLGSLESGKDADFVIWSGDPLSSMSRCEQTWIEGVKYFDIDEDQKLQADLIKERERLVQIYLRQKKSKPEAGS